LSRASKICSAPGCPNFQPCPDHERKPWEGSRRRERLEKPSGHRQQKLRRFVLHRDDFRCHVCREQFAPAQLVNDHVVPVSEGGADDVGNMAPCCTGEGTNRCHDKKSADEARRGRT
jgi:5-methylcytosine-specific restriction endonuclease McrA